tara:strand:+ start:2069 stop:3334 length:1266 start_codon:yes stop_codon:yes gene_type:complete
MFFIYQLLLSLTILISPLIVIIRILKGKEDIIRFKEKFCSFSKARSSGKLLWVHGASVGEIMSVIPLLNKYDNDNSIDQILITSSTLSSSKILEKYKFNKVIHQFFPIDHFFLSKLFLNYWKPHLAIFLESEIWPSMYKEIKLKKIPLILLNARITKKTFNRWIRYKKYSSEIFKLIDTAYPQNNETKDYLKKLSVKEIKLIGNIKYIENIQNKLDKIENNLKLQFKKYKICVSASTHENEELFAAKTHILLKKKNKKLITILIPRHINRVKKIDKELKSLKLNTIFHSSKNKNLKNIDVYIVDTFGESKKFYKIATTVFLGGSIINKGGQNPLEPARYGAKILHGPHVGNFAEIYSFLKSLKISKEVANPKGFANQVVFKKDMTKVKKIKKIGEVIFKNTIKELDKKINYENKKTPILGL